MHIVERQTLNRANRAFLLTIVGGGLMLCAFGAAIYDLTRLFE